MFRALCNAGDDGVVSVAKVFEDSGRIPVDALRELERAGLIKVDNLDAPNTVAINPTLCHLLKDGPSSLIEEADSSS